MSKVETMKQLRAASKKAARAAENHKSLVAERDRLVREAKEAGATWQELATATGMKSPTAIARALSRQG